MIKYELKKFLKTMSSITLVCFPIMIGLYLAADNFILAIYGIKWIQVIPILKIFLLLGVSQAMMYPAAWIFYFSRKNRFTFQMDNN